MAKVERVSERAVPSVTERFFGTTSRVSPSPPSDVWLVVAVSSVSQPVSVLVLMRPRRFSDAMGLSDLRGDSRGAQDLP